MTDKRLLEVFQGTEENYLLPFYWQHGNHREKIPEQIQRIYESGCRALCVESRPHPHFGEDAWWDDMDLILSECQKRDMKVWILDDKHFPTGYANGKIKEKYPQHRAWFMREYHLDVYGPMKEASFLVRLDTEEEKLLTVVAYKRNQTEEVLSGKPILLTHKVHNGFLYWDVPEGCYRIFFIHQTRKGALRDGYIDMLSEASVNVLINEVYELHYEHYGQYFGNTLAGFFSDEPEFGNGFVGAHAEEYGFHDLRIGQIGLALPYSKKVLTMMAQELGEDPSQYLGELWYTSDHAPLTRLAYMNAVTRLYEQIFCNRIGTWCRERGVAYIGHVIEDQGCHARLGHGTGHYYRALRGQDMAGIDIVLHQVMPGFAHMNSAARLNCGCVDAAFYHYLLAKLAASLSHQEPRMKGRAMCEVFGAYGWAEGAPFMKWLIDFLLVRGINHFVPHAFSPEYPDGDCPPHFGAEGHDPQFDGFSAIMKYTNKAAHLLTGGIHIASAAILYHAEAEWMNPRDTAMLTQVPAKALYDAHIDFDVVSVDSVCQQMTVKKKKLCLGEETFHCLIVPYAPQFPKELMEQLEQLRARGAEILFVDQLPDVCQENPECQVGVAVPVEALPQYIKDKKWDDVKVEGDHPLLRIYHMQREENHIYMLFNESPNQTAQTTIRVPSKGNFARLQLLENKAYRDNTPNGKVQISLLAGQSEILVFGDCDFLPLRPTLTGSQNWSPNFDISIANASDLSTYYFYMQTDQLHNISAPTRLPDFSGKIRYAFTVTLDEKHISPQAVLNLGSVGQTAKLTVNGHECGIRVCQPYEFTVGELVHPGINTFVIEVANTLVAVERDPFSYFMTIPPTGLLGPLTYHY